MTKERMILRISRVEEKGTALAFLLFSLLFIAAQVLHPDIFHIQMISSGAQWIDHFRNQPLLHLAHLLEFFCAPLLIIMALHLRKVLTVKAPLLSFVGLAMVFIGALMLLGNKSALCLTISGFDRLSNEELNAMIPGLEVLLKKEGMLVVLWLLPLLPIGFVVMSIALIKTRLVPLWQSIAMLLGSLLLANPEIEVINFFASFFLAFGLIPYSIRLFRQGQLVEVN